MKAIVISDQAEPVQLVEKDEPLAKEGQCLVEMSYTALNRRDQWIREGMYPGITLGVTLGSDGCGTVLEGSDRWKGKKVIINPNVNWGENNAVQSGEYSVLGMPTDGTLSERISISEERLHEIPSYLSEAEAAALPLAGLTAYRATIKKGAAIKGKKVLVTGAGGGVASFAVSFAVAAGAEVYVTSSQKNKIDSAVDQGAIQGFDYTDQGWVKEAAAVGGFDTIIDSAGGNQLNQYLKLIKPSGRIVIYGSTAGYPEKVDLFRLFWSQAQIMGSTMGSDSEFGEMIDFVTKHQIKPKIDQIFSVADYLQAFDRFKDSDALGKIVIDMKS